MRQARLVNLAVVLAIVVASSVLAPTELQALCDTWDYSIEYWDYPDANGNCPVGHVNLVGYYERLCNGNIIQWGIQGGCDPVLTYWEYCGDCEQG